MTGLAVRLNRLEARHGLLTATQRCPECGRLPNGMLPPDAPRAMVLFDGHKDGTPDNCPRCGARLVLRLEFDSPNDVELRHE